jgi:hypothetical protein
MAKRDEGDKLAQMWADLQARGWKIKDTVNQDGDPYTALFPPKGNSEGSIWGRGYTWRDFPEEINRAWKKRFEYPEQGPKSDIAWL